MIGDIGGQKPCLFVKNCNLELAAHGWMRAKLNVKTQEEPKEDDEDEEEAEDEAFESFSVVPFSVFCLFFACSVLLVREASEDKRLFPCFSLFDVRLMHSDSVKFTRYFLIMLSFGESCLLM